MTFATPAVVTTFERSIFRWLVHQYGFEGQDENGLSIFAVHPRDWNPLHYDFVLRWNEFKAKESKPLVHMRPLVEEAKDLGIDMLPLEPIFPTERKPMHLATKIAIGAGAILGGWYLLKPTKFDHLKNIPPVDVKPAEDILIDIAHGHVVPRKRAKMTTTTTVVEDDE